MKRQMIAIDSEKCNGCGACASACKEGAIAMVEGKARLVREDYCDGLGNCLPACPTGAISFEEREAPPFNAEAHRADEQSEKLPCGCPGTHSRGITHAHQGHAVEDEAVSRLSQWPVQIQLVPVNAPYFDGARLLVAADCTAYAFAGFHEKFIKGHITLVGCPKLDDADYAEKLTQIIARNDIKSVTVVRMEVPCCSGLERAVVTALKNSGKFIPWQVVVISTEGEILS